MARCWLSWPGGMMITQVYGMTETCGDGIINYAQDEKHIRSAGKPDDTAI